MIHTLPGNRSAVESRRQRLRGGQCPARNRNLLDVLRLQMDPRQLCHLPGTEDQDRSPPQVSENLLGECNRRIADRHRALAEVRFAAHALADTERGGEQAIRYGAGRLQLAGRGVGGLDLAKDLRLATEVYRKAGAATPMTDKARELFERAAKTAGDLDLSAISTIYENSRVKS